MWKCDKCGEEIEDTFDRCWKCAPPVPAESLAPRTSTARARKGPCDSLAAAGAWCWFFSILAGIGALTSVVNYFARNESDMGRAVISGLLCTCFAVAFQWMNHASMVLIDMHERVTKASDR